MSLLNFTQRSAFSFIENPFFFKVKFDVLPVTLQDHRGYSTLNCLFKKRKKKEKQLVTPLYQRQKYLFFLEHILVVRATRETERKISWESTSPACSHPRHHTTHLVNRPNLNSNAPTNFQNSTEFFTNSMFFFFIYSKINYFISKNSLV